MAESILRRSKQAKTPVFTIASAQLAMRHNDWTEALNCWNNVRLQSPDCVPAYLGVAKALCALKRLDEAGAVLADARKHFPAHADVAIAEARLVHERRDWPSALQHWNFVRERFPDEAQAYFGAGVALWELGRLDEAEGLFGAAWERFPDRPAIATSYARLAQRRRDWSEALRRWESARERFPVAAEADIRLSQTMERFPEHPGAAAARAELAQARNDWPEAWRRWREVHRRFPSIQLPSSMLVRAAKLSPEEKDDIDDIDALIGEARERFPTRSSVAIAYANLAQSRRDLPEALRRWEYIHDRFPDLADGPLGMARTLRDLGRFDEADKLYVAIRDRFPDRYHLAREYITIAIRRRDWQEAVRRHQVASEQFANFLPPRIFAGMVTNLAKLDDIDRLAETSASDGNWQSDDAHSAIRAPFTVLGDRGQAFDNNGAEIGQLMMNFESMGNNCEFGLVQRHYGAEPISLLRWSGTPPLLLAEAIAAGFEGFGQPQNTELQIRYKEYHLVDVRFQTRTHTFVHEGDVDEEKFYQMMTRRLQYLSRKFIEDLTNAEKIFVYRSSNFVIEEVSTLHRAMRSYGKCALLFVDRASAASTVTRLADGLFLGGMDRFLDGGDEKLYYDGWVSICRQAYNLWDGRSSVPAPPTEGREWSPNRSVDGS